MQMTVQVVLACVAAVMVASHVRAELELLACPVVEGDKDNATFFSNPYNCSTYYVCEQGHPTLMPCAPGTEFNDVLKVCVYPIFADCIELPLPTEAPTTEPAHQDQPLTERIVITKTEKEIIRPVEPESEPETAV
ncbi:unnamed protein product [Ixodes hexagonus]